MELGPFLEAAEQQFQHNLLPVNLPAQWSHRQGKADLELTSKAWRTPSGAQVRCAHLAGPRAEILNLMGYPRQADHLPILAVDLILFGRVPRVAVIDLQPAQGWRLAQLSTQAPWALALSQQALAYASRLSPGGPTPSWAGDYFTPWCLFSRPESLEELPVLLEAFKLYLGQWCQLLQQDRSQGQTSSHLLTYLSHHREHMPGIKFLDTSFGSPWTESFLQDFLYADQELPWQAA